MVGGEIEATFSARAFSSERVALNVVDVLRKRWVKVETVGDGRAQIIVGVEEFKAFIKRDETQEIASNVFNEVGDTMQ